MKKEIPEWEPLRAGLKSRRICGPATLVWKHCRFSPADFILEVQFCSTNNIRFIVPDGRDLTSPTLEKEKVNHRGVEPWALLVDDHGGRLTQKIEALTSIHAGSLHIVRFTNSRPRADAGCRVWRQLLPAVVSQYRGTARYHVFLNKISRGSALHL